MPFHPYVTCICNMPLEMWCWLMIYRGPTWHGTECSTVTTQTTCFMMTSSNGNIFRVTGHLCGEFAGHRWIHHTKASDAELWCILWSAPWINGRVKNCEAGDLRRHRTRNHVTIMSQTLSSQRTLHIYPSQVSLGESHVGSLWQNQRDILRVNYIVVQVTEMLTNLEHWIHVTCLCTHNCKLC